MTSSALKHLGEFALDAHRGSSCFISSGRSRVTSKKNRMPVMVALMVVRETPR